MRRIRLTESQLHRVIKESVKRILREGEKWGDWELPEKKKEPTKDEKKKKVMDWMKKSSKDATEVKDR